MSVLGILGTYAWIAKDVHPPSFVMSVRKDLWCAQGCAAPLLNLCKVIAPGAGWPATERASLTVSSRVQGISGEPSVVMKAVSCKSSNGKTL